MKRFLLSFVLLASVISAQAFSYERAREQALFLSDKMAYELNLTEGQYDMAYQINLDYFMNISSHYDIYGVYWQYRDADLRYVLYDWQYSLYRSLDYFYQPLRWVSSAWYFPIYSHYSRTHFFFGRPGVYISYRGGWRPRQGRTVSPYASHRPVGGRGLRDHHYPGAGHVGGPQPQGRGQGGRGGNFGRGGHGSVGSQGQGGRGGQGSIGSQGQGGRGGQGSVGSQGQGGRGGQGSVGSQGQGGRGGQGSVGSQGQGGRGGQGSVGSQGQGGRGGQGSVGSQGQGGRVAPGNAGSPRTGAGSGRAGGRSYGR